MPELIRAGAVRYLNTKPLIYGLAERSAEVELVLDVPSRLADGLSQGWLDVALVPSIECFRGREYQIVPDVCIAARGAVLSVTLFSRVEVGKIRRLALDAGSRTSVALVQILLAKQWGIRPQLISFPLGQPAGEVDADAVLLIGDRAIQHPPGATGRLPASASNPRADKPPVATRPFTHALDLAEAWVRWTGLPFVFAMWAASPEADLRGVDQALREARDKGLAHVDEIAAAHAADVGLSPEACHRYLTENLYYYLGPAEMAGLKRFYQLACQFDLAPEGVELGYYDHTCAAKGG